MLTEKERKKEILSYKAAALQVWLSGAVPDIKIFDRYLAKIGLSEDTIDNGLSRDDELKKALAVIEKVKKIHSKNIKK